MIDLQIHQGFGQIGLKITPFQYNLTIKPPDLQVYQQPAQITLEQPAATLEINLTPARESLGYSGIATQQRVFNENAKAASDSGIERRVLEGNELGRIDQKISVAQVIDQSTKLAEKDLELVNIQPIQISIQSNPLRWEAQLGGVTVDLDLGTVHGELQYGSVHTYMAQEPYVQTRAVGSLIEMKG